ncbi:MAG: high frequency lysogenization protein HflD [Gammaproteobacteria bacterium]|nr:high frequency lysogenization protein HflD [Gammaproteobacteria bacterium]
MSRYSDADRVVALGGVFQGARLARDVARNGVCDAAAFDASRQSLFDFEPDSVASIFGGVAGIAHGLRTLTQQIERPSQRDLEVARYVIALIHLGDLLMRDAEAMQGLHDDLIALARRQQHFELGDTTSNEQLAEIYQQRISVLGPRIMIGGEPLHLQNPDNAARIRVALLAGIRAAVLWRQAGGKKWQLLLRRRAISRSSRELVDTLPP